VAQDGVGNTSHKKAAEPGAAVGRHDHQIGASIRYLVDDAMFCCSAGNDYFYVEITVIRELSGAACEIRIRLVGVVLLRRRVVTDRQEVRFDGANEQ